MDSVKILITDEELLVADDLRTSLGHLGYQVTGVASSLAEAIDLAAVTEPNVVLMDIKLRGGRDGRPAADQLRPSFDIPVIYLTGLAEAETLKRAGTTLPYGYLVKPYQEQNLSAAIDVALRLHQTQILLRRLERFLSTTLKAIDEGVIAVDPDANIAYLNAAAERLTGWTLPEAQGRPWDSVFRLLREDHRTAAEDPVLKVMRSHAAFEIPVRTLLITRGGAQRPLRLAAAPLEDQEGKLTGVVLTFRDCSEEQAMSRKLLETQKLESLGLLAGGFAHDLNNLLTGMVTYADLIGAALPPDAPETEYARQIREAGRCAADLCRQILSYAGQGERGTTDLDLSQLVADTLPLLHASIHRDALLNLCLSKNMPRIRGNPCQIRQVIMNLVINASDALEGKAGNITVKTGLARVDGEWLKTNVFSMDIPEGQYLLLEVGDTGCGMGPDTLAKIFDPFFTTKTCGRGLGLASVHGIVREHQGALRVDSRPGAGTVFSLAFPIPPGQAESQSAASTLASEGRPSPGGDPHSSSGTLASKRP